MCSFHLAFLKFPLATIAAVNGYALAGGFDMATMCDIRIASENVKFGHPEMSFGYVVYSPLHDIVGGAQARELILTGRTIDASEALSIGLVSKVVPGERLEVEARNGATQIAKALRHFLLRTKAKIITEQV
ncbi:MAG: enoyl-CoA hydratase/isomerase family protein [Spirochaetota bacterium]|nr:enoyl-CoA hydratase/isomerase family protein [Spirochaetota bacterium]